MLLKSKNVALTALAFFLAAAFACPAFSAQDHVVSSKNLHQAIIRSASSRKDHITQVEGFFSSPSVQKALEKSGMNLKQVRQAVPSLSNQELAQLAQRTHKIQSDFAAGALTNQQLTYIVIAIATAIIIILIFEA